MMTCNDVRKLIPFMDDDDYRDERIIEAERHLARCPACAAEYQKTQSMLSMVRDSAPEYEVSDPSRYLADVRRKIVARKHRHVVAYRVIPAVAAMFLIVAIGLYSIMFNPTYNTMVRNELFNSDRQNSASIDNLMFDDESQALMDEYLAQQYFGVGDVYELIDATEPEEEMTLEMAMNTYTYDDITPEDIIMMLDETEYELMLASF